MSVILANELKNILFVFSNLFESFMGESLKETNIPHTVAPTDEILARLLKQNFVVDCDVYDVKYYIKYFQNGGKNVTRITLRARSSKSVTGAVDST